MVSRRKDQPKEKKNSKQTPREIAKDITLGKKKPQHIGPRSIEVVQQELTSIIQNYQETFNPAEQNEWENKVQRLIHELQGFKR